VRPDNNRSKDKALLGNVLNPVHLLQYQDGSVVSRAILKKATGTVTLFAFDEEQGLSEHTTPFDALVHILDGDAEIVISGEPHHLKAGEMPRCQGPQEI